MSSTDFELDDDNYGDDDVLVLMNHQEKSVQGIIGKRRLMMICWAQRRLGTRIKRF